MGLYRNVDRIMADLAAAGFDDGQALTVDDLTPFDQYHYEGTEAVDDACEFLKPGPGTSILDVGSGLGGPARYIAARTGSSVTALEIQSDLNRTAATLTGRCGLDGLVNHVHGDILAGDPVVASGAGGADGAPTGDAAFDGRTFDGIVSMLCILHIPDRATLFTRCAAALKPGGAMFIDDYVARGPLTDDEKADLAEKVYCPYVPDRDTYIADVADAGFTDIQTVDKTADWTAFVTDRLAAFQAARRDLANRYGAETVDGLDDFYSTVAALFTNGHLGGLRLTARLAT